MDDKYSKAIEMTEHPERFSPEELQSLFADPEIREIYDILCGIDSALLSPTTLSQQRIDEEWLRFSRSGLDRRRNPIDSFESNARPLSLRFRRGRAAAVAAITLTSVAALAIGVGIVTRSFNNKTEIVAKEVATIPEAIADEPSMVTEITGDTVQMVRESIVFENEKLGNMLDTISRHYGLKLEVVNRKALEMRLFFKWNPQEEAPEVVRQLNNFQRIKLKLEEDALIVR